MNALKKLSVATLIAGSLFAGGAHAGVMALADMNITALGLFSSPGVPSGAALTIGATELRTGNLSAVYNSSPVSNTGNVIGTAQTLDLAAVCAGDCAAAAAAYGGTINNQFGVSLGLPVAGNFAVGDMNISGSALGGAVNGFTRANAVSMGGTNSGSANTSILNSGSISGTFGVDQTFTGMIGVGADYLLRTYVDAFGSGFASAGYGWNIVIKDGATTVLNFAPELLNQSSSADDLASSSVLSGSEFFFSTAYEFVAGRTYTFTINQSSNAIISEVPEPATLALMGMGMVGLALGRRRARSK